MHPNIKILEIVVEGLQSLLDGLYFVGGTTTLLYLDKYDLNAPELKKIRPTEDVDCVAEIRSYPGTRALDKILERLGFAHCMDRGAPICRWIFKGIKVDVMPSDGAVLGFSNDWYPQAIQHFQKVSLPSGRKIRIFPAPYFLASKFEAFKGRGKGDFFGSKDLEDIVIVVHGRRNLRDEILSSPSDVQKYLKGQFSIITNNESFIESLSGHLADQTDPNEAAREVLEFLRTLTQE